MASSLDIPYQYTDAGKKGTGMRPGDLYAGQADDEARYQQQLAAYQQRNAGMGGGDNPNAAQIQDQTNYSRMTSSPDYQMGQYQVQQANRTPTQKGTDAGTALRALQEASGLNLLGSSSSFGTGYGASGVGSGAAVPRVAPPDTTAARNAAFARAKDQAGQTSRAAITALRENLSGRGLLGSGIEGGQTAEIIAKAAQGPNEVTREQAIQDALAAQRQGAMQYQGDITQRGQDISAQEAELARQSAQRAQAMQGLLSVINSAGILY